MENASEAYRAFLAGDETALETLVRAYRPGLRQYLFGIVHDMDLADDLTQETFVKLCLKRPHDRGTASFKTWLYTIGRNIAIDHLRRAAKQQAFEREPCFRLPDERDTPEGTALVRERRQLLLEAMETLKPAQAQALYLRYFEDFEIEQIAKILKKSRHAVSALLYRARGALRTALEQEGFSDEN